MTQRLSGLPCVERVKHIVGRCAGRTVLHVGCTSFPNTRARIRSGTLLHARVARAARLLHGIDVDERGLEDLRAEGFRDVFAIDAARLAEHHDGLLPSYEVILLADVLEHVADPGVVLAGARQRLAPGGELIVSTVNAFYLYGTLRVMLGAEVTNPEHVASYSQSNLREVMRRTGFEIVELRGCYEPYAHRGLVVRALKRLEAAVLAAFPGVSAGILCIANARTPLSREGGP